MNLSHLGRPVGPMVRVHGGLSNRMWRHETDRGVFAVKELRLDRDWTYRHEDVFRVEQAAFAAGIPMPEPISADGEVLVHRWVDGSKVPEEPVHESFAYEIGEILAHLHSLDIEWTHVSVEDPMPTDWPQIADRAMASQQSWADDAVAVADTLLAISEFVDGCERRGPIVLTHKDINPRNLLDAGGRPVVVDWENAGKLHLASELGSTALNVAKSFGWDHIERDVFRAVLDGYVQSGGALPEPGPDWFVDMISGWARFMRWNMERCIVGVEEANGPELALSHESVCNGLRGLPEMFALLPELEDLVA